MRTGHRGQSQLNAWVSMDSSPAHRMHDFGSGARHNGVCNGRSAFAERRKRTPQRFHFRCSAFDSPPGSCTAWIRNRCATRTRQILLSAFVAHSHDATLSQDSTHRPPDGRLAADRSHTRHERAGARGPGRSSSGLDANLHGGCHGGQGLNGFADRWEIPYRQASVGNHCLCRAAQRVRRRRRRSGLAEVFRPQPNSVIGDRCLGVSS